MNRLFDIKKTQLEMVQDRGYNISQDEAAYLEYDLDQFQTAIKEAMIQQKKQFIRDALTRIYEQKVIREYIDLETKKVAQFEPYTKRALVFYAPKAIVKTERGLLKAEEKESTAIEVVRKYLALMGWKPTDSSGKKGSEESESKLPIINEGILIIAAPLSHQARITLEAFVLEKETKFRELIRINLEQKIYDDYKSAYAITENLIDLEANSSLVAKELVTNYLVLNRIFYKEQLKPNFGEELKNYIIFEEEKLTQRLRTWNQYIARKEKTDQAKYIKVEEIMNRKKYLKEKEDSDRKKLAALKELRKELFESKPTITLTELNEYRERKRTTSYFTYFEQIFDEYYRNYGLKDDILKYIAKATEAYPKYLIDYQMREGIANHVVFNKDVFEAILKFYVKSAEPFRFTSQVFFENELTYNPTFRIDVPQHELIPELEENEFLDKLKVTKAKLPIIHRNEPVIKYYGWDKLRIVKINRDDIFASILSPKSLNFRVIID